GRVWMLNDSDGGIIAGPTQTGSAFSSKEGDVDIIAGGADVWGTSDQFHFVYSKQTNDFDVKVKVQRLDPANTWAKAGIMARETLDPASATIQSYTTPDQPPGTRELENGRRPTTGVDTVDWAPSRPRSPLPDAWVRLKRVGNVFTSYYGTNGLAWTVMAGPVTQAMTNNLYLGLFTTSHDAALLTTAEFRNFGPVGNIAPI